MKRFLAADVMYVKRAWARTGSFREHPTVKPLCILSTLSRHEISRARVHVGLLLIQTKTADPVGTLQQ